MKGLAMLRASLLSITLAAALLGGCGTTVTLKSKQPADAPVPSAEGAASDSPAAEAPPAAEGAATSERAPAPEVTAAATSAPRSSAPSFPDRFKSGLHSGTVGAAFGGLGGPIGMAAGGGAGFVAGFVAGRPIFGRGGSAPGAGGGWEDQVEDQEAWEAQVAARVDQLDSGVQPAAGGIGSEALDATAYPAAAGAPRALQALPDPLEDYEAWAEQVMNHAEPTAEGAKVATAGKAGVEAAAPPAETPPAAENAAADADLLALLSEEEAGDGWRLRALDADDDGRADAWFGYDGEVLRRHAMDRNSDGRPDRLDVYEGDQVAERRFDEDGDGRFERRETIEEGRVTSRLIDQNGDGRFETLTLPVQEGAPAAAAVKAP
ncbi:MAG: hypothetical protein Q8R92_19935 [Deltaproteobacteria bacterium]|nr:hypothetical protein [Deltaproteobacteria bacterium]